MRDDDSRSSSVCSQCSGDTNALNADRCLLIAKILLVYTAAFLLSVVVSLFIPLYAPAEKMNFYRTLVNYFPNLVLLIYLFTKPDGKRLNPGSTLDVQSTITVSLAIFTLLLGLAAPLLFLFSPKRYKKYAYLISVPPLVGILSVLFPYLFPDFQFSLLLSILINLIVLILVVRESSGTIIHTIRREIVPIAIISLYFPACAVLCYFLVQQKKANSHSSGMVGQRCLIATSIVALLLFALNLFILFASEGMATAYAALLKSAIYLILCVVVGIIQLCDKRVRTIPHRVGFYISAFFFPYLVFPATEYCLEQVEGGKRVEEV